MELTDSDLAQIRQYLGSSPDDDELYVLAEPFTYWQETALSVLRVRRADAASGDSTTSFSLSGVLSVGMKAADLATLNADILELERQLAELTGEPLPGGPQVSRMNRPDRGR